MTRADRNPLTLDLLLVVFLILLVVSLFSGALSGRNVREPTR